MVIYGVSFDMVGKQPIVLLKTVESNKFLPIWIGHPEAAAIAWMVAAGNNFVWNRHWTFKARDGQIHVQALRFLFVSLIALGVNLLVLTLLVQAWGVDKIAAQAIALAASTPLNFLGNKLWSFRADLYSEPSPPQES